MVSQLVRDEMSELIGEYNKAEIEQEQRLVKLFKMLQARKGYRMVAFRASNSQGPVHRWTNCWDTDNPQLMLEQHVQPLGRYITDIQTGVAP